MDRGTEGKGTGGTGNVREREGKGQEKRKVGGNRTEGSLRHWLGG